MRILYLINRMSYGGAAAVVTQWSTWLAIAGHEVTVCALYSGGQFADRLRAEGIEVLQLSPERPNTSYDFPGKYRLSLLIRVARLVSSGEYDVVHAHLFPTSVYVALTAAFIRGPCYVFSEHSVSNRRRNHKVLKLLDRAIYRGYSRIVAVSRQVAEALAEWLPETREKTVVITNSVSPTPPSGTNTEADRIRQELSLSPDEPVILFAGRLVSEKGPDVLLDATRILFRSGRRPRVLIAGTGHLEASVRQRVEDDPELQDVSLLGLRKDVDILLRIADLLVIPSRWEGLPMILLEAMSIGTPVVASAVGGIPEVITSGVDGVLVPPERPDALAAAVGRLLETPLDRADLGLAGRRRLLSEFTSDVVLPRLVRVYEEASGDGTLS